jgi:hypothetical protein
MRIVTRVTCLCMLHVTLQIKDQSSKMAELEAQVAFLERSRLETLHRKKQQSVANTVNSTAPALSPYISDNHNTAKASSSGSKPLSTSAKQSQQLYTVTHGDGDQYAELQSDVHSDYMAERHHHSDSLHKQQQHSVRASYSATADVTPDSSGDVSFGQHTHDVDHYSAQQYTTDQYADDDNELQDEPVDDALDYDEQQQQQQQYARIREEYTYESDVDDDVHVLEHADSGVYNDDTQSYDHYTDEQSTAATTAAVTTADMHARNQQHTVYHSSNANPTDDDKYSYTITAAAAAERNAREQAEIAALTASTGNVSSKNYSTIALPTSSTAQYQHQQQHQQQQQQQQWLQPSDTTAASTSLRSSNLYPTVNSNGGALANGSGGGGTGVVQQLDVKNSIHNNSSSSSSRSVTDGKTEQVFDDGRRIVWFRNGTQKETYPGKCSQSIYMHTANFSVVYCSCFVA